MTDAERLAAIKKAGITDEQLSALASGHIVLWQAEGVRRDERERCVRIANAQYGAIDADPDDYIGKERHSDSWKMACTKIAMLINSTD